MQQQRDAAVFRHQRVVFWDRVDGLPPEHAEVGHQQPEVVRERARDEVPAHP